MKPYASRSHEDMKTVLLHPDQTGPEIHYYMIRGGSDKKNITIWEPGIIGDEYIKSFGHYHVGNLEETYKILSGEGIIILQWRKKDESGKYIDDQIEKMMVRHVKSGDEVFIPAEAGHLMINIGLTWLVTEDSSPVNFENKNEASMPGHADYEPLRKLHGAAVYIINQNGTPTIKQNPNYSSVPNVTIE